MKRIKINEEAYRLQPCTLASIDNLLSIQAEAFKHLDYKETLRKNSKEMLESCLQPPHHTIGVFYRQKMIAFGILYIGGNSDENLAKNIGIEPSMIQKTANIKLIIVRPQYRGNRLQCVLIEAIEAYAIKQGFKQLACTIAPGNSHSIINFEKKGYRYYDTIETYGGLKRNRYLKKLP